MSYSTRVILAIALTYGLSLPLNVLSVTYLNPWICEDCNEVDISFYVPPAETFTLKYTGNSIEAFPPVTTNATVTGGIFGKTLYQLYKLAYYWKTNYLLYTFTLQVNAIYFNTKYESYANALNYPDGIVQVTNPVFANAIIDNPEYYKFEQAFNQIKPNPGKITCLLNKNLADWFITSPPEVTYAYYRSSYYDQDTEKSYPCATTVNLPMSPFLNYISCRQYLSTFGSLTDTSRKPLNNPPPFTIPTSLVGWGWNVKVFEIAG